MELHGGTIGVASDGIDHGSEFKVTLPLSLSAERIENGAPDGSPSPPVSGRKVLVVDDNVDSADMTALLLENIGYEVRTAYAGNAALDQADAFRPDIVLLDLGLPDLNGYEVARRIRTLPWGGDVVLVAISGWGRDEDRRRSTAAGFDRHLTKPVDPDLLFRTIRDTAPNAARD